MVYVELALSKYKKPYARLCIDDTIVSFDTNVILKVFDWAPSELSAFLAEPVGTRRCL